jgi:hypothetical protein
LLAANLLLVFSQQQLFLATATEAVRWSVNRNHLADRLASLLFSSQRPNQEKLKPNNS